MTPLVEMYLGIFVTAVVIGIFFYTVYQTTKNIRPASNNTQKESLTEMKAALT